MEIIYLITRRIISHQYGKSEFYMEVLIYTKNRKSLFFAEGLYTMLAKTRELSGLLATTERG